MQVQEGSLDSSHVGILHLDTLAAMKPGVPRDVGSFHFSGEQWDHTIDFPGADGMPSSDNAPRIDVEDTPFGFQYAAVRQMADETKSYVRVTAFAMPFTAHIGGSSGAVIVVPRDDDTCSFIGVRVVPQGAAPPAPDEAEGWSNDPMERRRYALPAQDRQAMASRQSFAGFLGGNRPQDGAVQGVSARTSMFTRAEENLLPAGRGDHPFPTSAPRGGPPGGGGRGPDRTTRSTPTTAAAITTGGRPRPGTGERSLDVLVVGESLAAIVPPLANSHPEGSSQLSLGPDLNGVDISVS